jgi:hypothetical protein
MAATRGTPSGIDVRSTSTAHQARTTDRRGADDRQDQTFDQQLPDETPASGAERRTDPHFALTGGRAGQQQVRDIRAGNQQHDADGPEQHQHPGPGRRTDQIILKRTHADEPVLVPDRMRLLERRGNLVHLGLRLFHRDAWFQPGDALKIEVEIVRVADALVGRDHIGRPQFGRLRDADGIREAGRHDAEHLVAAAFERDRATEDGGVRVEAPFPEAIAEDDHLMASPDLVLRGEGLAHRRPHPQDIEELRRDLLRLEVLRLRTRLPQGDIPGGDGRHGVEHLLLGGPVHVVLRRDPTRRGRGRRAPLADRDEPVVFVERQAAQHDGVHHREDRRAGADAEDEHDQGDGRERLRGSQAADGGFQIFTHGTFRRLPTLEG